MIDVRSKIEKDYAIDFDSLDVAVMKSVQLGIAGLARATQSEWIRLAQSRLGTSRVDYINGLRQAESYKVIKADDKNTVFEISLVGRMPNNYEFGMPSFDMKSVRPGWLGGKKARKAKDGHSYVVIPLRHSVSASATQAYTGKAAAVPNLKQELRSAMKNYGLDRMIRTATGQVVKGKVGSLPPKAAVHPYLKGLTKYQNSARGVTSKGLQRGSSQLLTFRVMSEKSRPGSWIHPGLKAANILPDVEKWVENKLNDILETILA